MREPALGLKTSQSDESFLHRIIENLRSWWLPCAPLPAAHLPLHLLDERRARTSPAAQMGSTFLHGLLFATMLWFAAQTAKAPANPPPLQPSPGPLSLSIPAWLRDTDSGSLGKHGSSGGHDTLPPTAGELAPAARVSLLSLHLSDSRPHPLAVPVTVADPQAPQFVRPVNELGLPWMTDRNHSEGVGKNGIGNGIDHGMGDGPGDGSGVGNDLGPYTRLATQVSCRVCPDPLYSDEARKQKLQGSVMLSVLVGPDGRAKDIRVIHGLGLGLDESALQAVRAWQFFPGRDAAQRPVAAWIKVETLFRLY